MRKQLLLFLFAILFTALGVYGANKAYVVLKESPLYILNERRSVEKTLPDKVAKGDTVYATAETMRFVEENRGKRMVHMPILYKGIEANISMSNVHPIRLEPGDTLTYFSDSTVKSGSFREQKLIPAMQWAMNVTKNPMQWLYLALISIGCGVGFYFLSKAKGLGMVGLTLVGVALAVMSVAEVMYYLSYDPHLLWFLQSSIVNGWGHVILNFFILAIVIGCQIFLFYYLWNTSFTVKDPLAIRVHRKRDEFDDDEDDEEKYATPGWISNIAFLPVLIGLVVIFLLLFNASAICYYILCAILIGGAAIGAVNQIVHGRLLPGIIFPLCYITGCLGLVVMTAALTYVLIIVAVVGLVIGLALSFIIGLFNSSGKVDFVDEDGVKHTGTRYMGGKVKSDKTGRMYKIKD